VERRRSLGSSSAQPTLATKSAPRARNRSSDHLLGALFVADFQVLELREVGKFLAGNAHRRAGLSEGGDELGQCHFAKGMQSRYPSSLKQGIREIVRADEENDSASQSLVEGRR
jgi:hypothetical protein